MIETPFGVYEDREAALRNLDRKIYFLEAALRLLDVCVIDGVGDIYKILLEIHRCEDELRATYNAARG